MANAAEQCVEFCSIFVLKRDERFENFDPAVAFLVGFAAEKLTKRCARGTTSRFYRFLLWKEITASMSFAFASDSSGVIDD